MARKSIIEATSQIMGQKEINHLADDRGPNDLEKIIDEQDKTISHLKHDNKTLAKEVSDLIEEKKRLLDNQSNKWYNRTMKNIMIALLVLCFTATVGNTNENKIEKYINNEITKTKEFQKVKWQEGKDQLTRTFTQIKSLFVKN